MKHLLSMAELSSDDIWQVLRRAQELQDEWQRGGNAPLLRGKVLGMIFQKPSLRTRVSFDVAMLHLGGHTLYFSPDEIGLGKRESVADVARVLSRYVDCIMARVFSHSHIEELAEYSHVPVINGLSDAEHPCQALADFFTIWQKLGELHGVRLAYVGDGNNVAVSLLFGAARLGMHMALAAPEGYQVPDHVISRAHEFARETGSQLTFTDNPGKAVKGADVIYTDVWTSMGQEAEAEVRQKIFPPYQVNTALVAKARPEVIVMHCLPAHRGEEITNEVADGPHSILFDQAENRLHIQKGILAILLQQTGG
jgi:ornithine carbamoyltransferase